MEGRLADPACIVRSHFDRVLTGLRGNEPRAVSMVHGTDGYKAIAFVLSGALTGIVGGTTAPVFGVVPLADRAFPISGAILLALLLARPGTMFGPAMEVLTLTTTKNDMARTAAGFTVIPGAILLVRGLALRRDVIGEIANWWRIGL